MNWDLTCVWVGERDGKNLYRIFNKADLKSNKFRIPLGTMTVDKATNETVVKWDLSPTHTCHGTPPKVVIDLKEE